MSADLEIAAKRRLSGSLLRLRSANPFFAAVAMFAKYVITETRETAATNGETIFFNPHFAMSLTPDEFDGVLIHEVLHTALLHVPRRGERDPLIWNIAADYVVNGIIAKNTGLRLPNWVLRDEKLEQLSVEEAYELLLHELERLPDVILDLVDEGGEVSGEIRRVLLEVYWRRALEDARMVTSSIPGTEPAGLEREFGALEPSRHNWRDYLWRFLVRTPVDFEGFDRRFVGRGLYMEALEGNSVRVAIAVDTSGSVTGDQLAVFLSEVGGILGSYPHIMAQLYYCDAEAHGPYDLRASDEFPAPVGFGGTDFRPFFRAIEASDRLGETDLCVYLTDGLGFFPVEAPSMPVLWVVVPGGLAREKFPFGEVIRLLKEG